MVIWTIHNFESVIYHLFIAIFDERNQEANTDWVSKYGYTGIGS